MTTLFELLLGATFDALPEPVRRIHTLDREIFTQGRSRIVGSDRLGAKFVRAFAGLPAPADDAEVSVWFTPLDGAREYWRREFAGRRYQSVMEAAPDGRLIEHFGVFDLYFMLHASSDGLSWTLDEWRLLGVPLPGFTRPRIDCFESAVGDAFKFDIDVEFPIVGAVVQYSGAIIETRAAEASINGMSPAESSDVSADCS